MTVGPRRRVLRMSGAAAAAALLTLAVPGAALGDEGGLTVSAPADGVVQLDGLAPGHPAAAVAVVTNHHDRAVVATVDAQVVSAPAPGLVVDVTLCAAPWVGASCPDGRVDVPVGAGAAAGGELAAGSAWYVRVSAALDPAAGNETQGLRARAVVVLTAAEAAGPVLSGGSSPLRGLALTGAEGCAVLLGVACLATATGVIAVMGRRRPT